MKNLLLEEIVLVSQTEKRAKRIKFHPRMTVIRGENDTGKTSVIKSIFQAFGADPLNLHPRWKSASVHTLLRIKIAGVPYKIYRHEKFFSLFSGENTLISNYKSISKELAPKLAELLDFKLVLTNRENETKIPPPAFMFAPFYINQDGGWQKTWNSFAGMGQFSEWKKDTIHYHTGIRPNQWYVLKGEIQRLDGDREEPRRNEIILNKLIERTEKEANVLPFDIDVDAYKKQIESLLNRCSKLKEEEDRYRLKVLEFQNEKIRLVAQQEILIKSQNELNADYEFAIHTSADSIDCPTCGANYHNDFASRFSIAQDEDKCTTLLQEVVGQLDEVSKKISDEEAALSKVKSKYEEINAILEEKQGDVTLQTLIESQGKKHLLKELHQNLSEVKRDLAGIDAQIGSLSDKMKDLDDRKRTQSILDFYREKIENYTRILRLSSIDLDKLRKIDCNIVETGSDLPRAILAYSISILKTMEAFGNVQQFPVVYDAINQQEQDEENIKTMLTFIRDSTPPDFQIIVGLVDPWGVDLGGKTIEMAEENFALLESEYQSCFKEVFPYIEASIKEQNTPPK